MDLRQFSRANLNCDIGEVILLGQSADRDELIPDCRVVDLSSGGLRLELPRRVPLDAPLRLNLADRVLLGEVRYCQPSPAEGRFQAGVALCQVLVHLDELERLVAQLKDSDSGPTVLPGAGASPSRSEP